jgi:hypothetical protein
MSPHTIVFERTAASIEAAADHRGVAEQQAT